MEKLWEVSVRSTNGSENGNDAKNGRNLLCRNVLLALGIYDLPRLLGIPGETSLFPLLSYRVPGSLGSIGKDLETPKNKVEGSEWRSEAIGLPLLPQQSSASQHNRTQILVIGSGLSAADTITLAMASGYKVLHSFRDPEAESKKPGNLKRFKGDQEIHPEYCAIEGLMSGTIQDASYVPYPFTRVVSIQKISVPGKNDEEQSLPPLVSNSTLLPQLSVTLGQIQHPSTSSPCPSAPPTFTVEAYRVFALCGSTFDLSILPPTLEKTFLKTIDTRKGRVSYVPHDPVTYQTLIGGNADTDGIYVAGPLIGDCFVRFNSNSAYAAAHDIQSKYFERKKWEVENNKE